MAEGDHINIICPSDLAYGPKGQLRANIPPNTELEFDMLMIEIETKNKDDNDDDDDENDDDDDEDL